MSQTASLTFRGAHRRAQRREVERVRAAVIQNADPNSAYWQTTAAERGATLAQSLPPHIDPDSTWEDLGPWADESPAQVRAEGYQRGLDYLANCHLHRTAAHLDVLLSQVRGRWWHNASIDDTGTEWMDNPRHYKIEEGT